MEDVFKVLGDKNRLKILEFLSRSENCVCNIHECIGIPQNLASHHLRQMKDVGLLNSRRAGKSIYYCINKNRIRTVLEYLSNI